jgi:hypothetical protein
MPINLHDVEIRCRSRESGHCPPACGSATSTHRQKRRLVVLDQRRGRRSDINSNQVNRLIRDTVKR